MTTQAFDNAIAELQSRIAGPVQLTDQRTQCEYCDIRISDDNVITSPEDESLCETCFDDIYAYCADDGSAHLRADMVEGPDGCLYRPGYASRNIRDCDDCGYCCWRDDMLGIGYRNMGYRNMICEGCYESNYFECYDCGERQHNDNYSGDGYCTSCHESQSSELIRNYSDDCVGELGFHGHPKDGLYFGVELETDVQMRDRDDVAQEVIDALGDDFAILKEDGSLSDAGFEIVTAPATIEIHAERFRRLMVTSPVRGLRSWNGHNCGMHIHVSRKKLSDLTIGKLLVFTNDHANTDLVTAIAGRGPNGYCHRFPKQFSDAHGRKFYENHNSERYQAINLQNDKTIEFRIFRGTLNYQSFMKNLEFVRSLIDFCKSKGLQQINQSEYLQYVASHRKAYQHLSAFLADKGYIPARKPAKV